MREILLLPCVFSITLDTLEVWQKFLQKEALDLYDHGRLVTTNETAELVECYLCNWISLENAGTGEMHLFGENCETTNERTETGFGETCGTIEIRRSIFDIPYSEVPYHDMKNSVHRWDVKMTLRVTSKFEVDNDFLLKTCSMDDSLCVFDCEDDLCNHSGYDGYPDDGRFPRSKTTIPKIVLHDMG
ncbi:Oidioi.mRNA.OKI2018_I69.PAR.g12048.t1.cds [Oikopleura dioica]|uniref:Oidioi.mRNA.OKI2018_I69.PAR.g12048.t1.cds n=1 Tax=Oikopleura dioica TaxID=34765 RepID=A0ABN7S1Q4_OIKDI|nr:Oidioi.mRNA.OKI2018_I69.PAR.g12048.t1.cds [Oikopleura dioica]